MAIFENIVWMMFVAESSITEAHIFHGVMPWTYTRINRHTLLAGMRAIVFVGIFGISVKCCIYLLPSCLMFPFLHDGLYYQTRNKLNPSVYPRGWKDTSTTTDARWSFGYEKRKKLFLIGGILWLIAVYANYRWFH